MYSILNNPSVKAKVNELLSNMTLAQKIGQMTQAERLSCTPTEAKNFHLGSLMCGSGSVPGNNRIQDWLKMADNTNCIKLVVRVR